MNVVTLQNNILVNVTHMYRLSLKQVDLPDPYSLPSQFLNGVTLMHVSIMVK